MTDLAQYMADPKRRAWFRAYLTPVGECLEWTGSRRKTGRTSGYGVVAIAGKSTGAHRVAYAMHYGVDPGELFVCHACDNPPCCRKEHLFLGTAKDNNQDMMAKGRHVALKGEQAVGAKLTATDVLTIRQLYRQGWGCKRIGRKFNVTAQSIWNVVNGVTWNHI